MSLFKYLQLILKILNRIERFVFISFVASICFKTLFFDMSLLCANEVISKNLLLVNSSVYTKSVYSLPLTLDPIKMNDTASLLVSNLIYDGLVKFSPTLSIEPVIAKSWKTSLDGLVITFYLNDNLKFHDGSKITAYDVEFSLMRLLSSESIVSKYYEPISRIKVIDEHTLELILKNPYPSFISILAGSTAKILPRKYLKDKSEIEKLKYFEHPIGSGAFKFSKIDLIKKEMTLESVVFKINKDDTIKKLVLKETSEDEAIKLASKGLVDDLANWPLQENNVVFLKGQKISSPVLATWIIGINSKLPPFNNLKIRKLFKESVDSEKFRIKFYPDAIKANGYVPYGLPASGSFKEISSNIKDNQKLNIKGSSQNTSTGDTSQLLKIQKIEKIVLAIPKELASSTEIKIFFESDLKKKGWKIEVQLVPWNNLMEGYTNKKLQAFLVSMNMDYPNAEFLLKNFESNSPDNFSGLNDALVNQLIKEFNTKQDKREREEIYKKVLNRIEELAVNVNLFYPRAHYWVSKCVNNFEPNLLSDVYIDYTKVSKKSECN